jgi:hypothetical protein
MASRGVGALPALVLVIFLCTFSVSQAIDFTKCLSLSDQLNYNVCWNVSGEELYLQFKLADIGKWIGFGLGESTSGSMPGSDIVTMALVNGTQPSVVDRNAQGFFLPEEDTCQDWVLVSASQGEEGGQPLTTFQVKRKLDTQDTQDRPITTGFNKIVWAVGKSTSISYHGSTRGINAIDFLSDSMSFTNLTSLGTMFEFRMPDVVVPNQKTTYICQSFSFPVVEDAHIVAIEPIVEAHSISKEFVHHFLVHVCEPGENGTLNYWDKYQQYGECSSPLGDLDTGCVSIVYMWALGAGPLVLPEAAGYRMGTKMSYGVRHGILEVHYDNPTLVANITDNSGVRFYYTDKIRPNDAAIMSVGDVLVNFYPIPPYLPPYAPGSYYQANCPSECTSEWSHDITVFADALHMHQAGSSIWSNHWRGSEYLGLFNRVTYYQFDMQQGTVLNKVIQRGDRLNLNCVYDTTTRTAPTKFAIGSEDEMCMEFLFYYPILFSTDGSPYAFCGYVKIDGLPANSTWCGGYNLDTALKPTLTNPTVIDPLSLGADSFGETPAQCQSTSPTTTGGTGDGGGSGGTGDGDGGGLDDGDGDGDGGGNDMGFGMGFLMGALSVGGFMSLVVAIGAAVFYFFIHRRSNYQQL